VVFPFLGSFSKFLIKGLEDGFARVRLGPPGVMHGLFRSSSIRGHQISHRQADATDHVLRVASRIAVEKNATVVAFGDRETWAAVVVSGA
jgi:hypothetical protein